LDGRVCLEGASNRDDRGDVQRRLVVSFTEVVFPLPFYLLKLSRSSRGGEIRKVVGAVVANGPALPIIVIDLEPGIVSEDRSDYRFSKAASKALPLGVKS
jgi:hypothetical protein